MVTLLTNEGLSPGDEREAINNALTELQEDTDGADGDAGSGTTAGSAGADVSMAGGDGGDKADTGAAAGGAGGDSDVLAGDGGDTASAGADDGGAGGDVNLTAGTGGDASAGTGDGGVGGDITLTPGAGGTSAGGNAGAPGKVKAAGLLFFPNAQVIDMADAAVALTLVPGTPAGTLLTSNFLRVDPNSTGADETLTLPPEADCEGLPLIINNTGGEGIVVNDDAAATIDTIATGEFGMFFCDGTAWVGMNQA